MRFEYFFVGVVATSLYFPKTFHGVIENVGFQWCLFSMLLTNLLPRDCNTVVLIYKQQEEAVLKRFGWMPWAWCFGVEKE